MRAGKRMKTDLIAAEQTRESARLVFNNQVTYVGGGFFLDYQDVPPQGSCAQTRYNGAIAPSGYNTNADCLWNVQSLANSTTGVVSRSLGGFMPCRRK